MAQVQDRASMMDVQVASDESQAASWTGEAIAQALRAKPDLVLGLATGRSMRAVYTHLVHLHQETALDFSHCRTFNLDEYIGIPADHTGAFRRYMEEHFFRHVNLHRNQIHLPDGMASETALECQRYEGLIQAAGGIDLQLLGLGLTGHIGFNEPPSRFESRTHVVRLTELTRSQNAEPFGGRASDVPASAITMGLQTIMAARRCLLLVMGAGKASILAKVVEGPVSCRVPGSVLQQHADCSVMVDRAASTLLSGKPDLPPVRV
jgi:glucosamine-6-phosphate deaminase